MVKNLQVFALLLFISPICHSTILIPTFFAHDTERVRYGEQLYSPGDMLGMLWQLSYWSLDSLVRPALSQALNGILSGGGKASGNVQSESGSYTLFHSSAGNMNDPKTTATLFYIVTAGVACIVGIAKHVIVKRNQPPIYEIIGWDDRYIRY